MKPLLETNPSLLIPLKKINEKTGGVGVDETKGIIDYLDVDEDDCRELFQKYTVDKQILLDKLKAIQKLLPPTHSSDPLEMELIISDAGHAVDTLLKELEEQ
jgi:hypothetical protein